MEKRKDLLLFAALLLGSFSLFFFSRHEEMIHSRELTSIDPKSRLVEDKVNQHLKLTARAIELQEQRVRQEGEQLPKVGDRLWPQDQNLAKDQGGLDFSSDPSEDSTYQDLNRHPKEYSNSRTPHAVIQNERAANEMNARQQESQREEYVRQFIENARRGGYIVKVNEDLVVTSVKKIAPQTSSLLESPSDSGAR